MSVERGPSAAGADLVRRPAFPAADRLADRGSGRLGDTRLVRIIADSRAGRKIGNSAKVLDTGWTICKLHNVNYVYRPERWP